MLGCLRVVMCWMWLCGQENEALDVEGSRAALASMTDEVNAVGLAAARSRGLESSFTPKTVDEVRDVPPSCHRAHTTAYSVAFWLMLLLLAVA